MELAYQRLQKEQATDTEVSQYYESVEAIILEERKSIETDTVCSAKLDSATRILLTAYKRQLVEKPHAADDPAYRLDSFQTKSTELLYRCTEALLANANESNRECLASERPFRDRETLGAAKRQPRDGRLRLLPIHPPLWPLAEHLRRTLPLPK